MPQETQQEVVRKSATVTKQVDESGMFEATIATLDTVDRDDDIIESGALGSQQKAKVSYYNHSSWGNTIPGGKAVLSEEDGKLKARGQLFLDLEEGSKLYKLMRHLEQDQEWSFGFFVQEWTMEEVDGKRIRRIKQLQVVEVSPVLMGAGIGTMTDSVKSYTPNYAASMTMKQHCLSVLHEAAALKARATALQKERENANRDIGEETLAELRDIAEGLKNTAGAIDSLSQKDATSSESESEPKKEGAETEEKDGATSSEDKEETESAQKEWLRFVAQSVPTDDTTHTEDETDGS